MIIALLAVLGVDLIVIVFVAAGLLGRRRWVSHKSGAFKGAIRVAQGEVPGLRPKWKRGFGRFASNSNVLVWTNLPLLFRTEVLTVRGPVGNVRPARPMEVKRLGDEPVVIRLSVDGGAQLDVAVPGDHRTEVLDLSAAAVSSTTHSAQAAG